MYPLQITICHWAGPFVNEMKTRAMKRALRFAVATRERRWTQTITQWYNQLRGNSWRGGDEMEKGSCRRAQLSHTAKPLFTQSNTPSKSMWCFSSAKSINAFIQTILSKCAMAKRKGTFWKIVEDKRTGAWAEAHSNTFSFAHCEMTFFVMKFVSGLPRGESLTGKDSYSQAINLGVKRAWYYCCSPQILF